MDLKPNDPVPKKLKDWHSTDRKHAADWRKEAREDYDFVAGKQYTDDEEQSLKDQLRPVVVFNRINPLVDAVLGAEMGNRQEVRYIPREEGDVKKDEALTSASEWFRDQTGADAEDSEMFRDTVVCGMGWTETRLDYETNPDGDPSIAKTDPFEMLWDSRARKRNLIDAERVWHIKKFPLASAKAMFADADPPFTSGDLDAQWATFDDGDGKGPHNQRAGAISRSPGTEGDNDELNEVTLVRVQWIERETFYRYKSPDDGSTQSLPKAEYEQANQIMASKGGQGLGGVKQVRKVRKQAFLGNVVLSAGNTACPDHFNFECCTGKLDRNKGTFYGLVRAMKDPQRWANKFFSQTMHIMNSNAKGGIMAERTAFENTAEAEEKWARPDGITWMNPGALSGPIPKVLPKPQTQFPVGLQYLIEFSSSSIRDVSGVNLELLGMREADQPGVLEFQRKQAALTVLQWLFDSLKTYRKRQGSLMLYYIQNDLSDGRLVKILGEGEAKYAPLVKQAEKEYDIIVDDMPTSPNHKEAVWSMLMNMPVKMQEMLSPPIMQALLKYSPLPTGVQEDITKAGQEAAQSPQAKIAEQMAQLEARVTAAEAGLKEAQTKKALAEAQQIGNEVQAEDPNVKAVIEREKNMGALQVQQQKAQGGLQLQAQRDQAANQVSQQAAQGDMMIAAARMHQDATLHREDTRIGAATKVKTAEIEAKAKPKTNGRTQ